MSIAMVLGNPNNATVGDLVDCLGNVTTYDIEPYGHSILVTSHIVLPEDYEGGDPNIERCLDQLKMSAAVVYTEAAGDPLARRDLSPGSRLSGVVASYVPTASCGTNFNIAP